MAGLNAEQEVYLAMAVDHLHSKAISLTAEMKEFLDNSKLTGLQLAAVCDLAGEIVRMRRKANQRRWQ